MTDWTELKDLQAVAKAQADGWEIELSGDNDAWEPWETKAWLDWVNYRGRPKVKSKEVVLRVPMYRDRKTGALQILPLTTSPCLYAELEFRHYLDELPHRWENGKLIVEVPV